MLTGPEYTHVESPTNVGTFTCSVKARIDHIHNDEDERRLWFKVAKIYLVSSRVLLIFH